MQDAEDEDGEEVVSGDHIRRATVLSHAQHVWVRAARECVCQRERETEREERAEGEWGR